MVGSAVETIVWSSAARSMPSSSAPRITHRRRLVIVSAMGGCCDGAHAHLPDVCHDRLRVGTSCSKCNHGQPTARCRRTPPGGRRRPRYGPASGEPAVAPCRIEIKEGQAPMRTRLTELLGVEHPVMLAGMGGVSYSELVAAVSEAGGFGCLGAGTMGNATMAGRNRSRARRPPTSRSPSTSSPPCPAAWRNRCRSSSTAAPRPSSPRWASPPR